jgi:hypothetical protein
MNDMVLVGMIDGERELLEDPSGAFERQHLPTRGEYIETRVELLAVDELHREVGIVGVEVCLEKVSDVGVRQPTEDLGLLLEALELLWGSPMLLEEHLDRDRAASSVGRAPDGAKGALSEWGDERVSIVEDVSRAELPLIHRSAPSTR